MEPEHNFSNFLTEGDFLKSTYDQFDYRFSTENFMLSGNGHTQGPSLESAKTNPQNANSDT